MSSSPSLESIKRTALARPEHELLLCCAHARKHDGRALRIKELLREEIDWEYFYHLAKRHAVLQLIYWQLNESAPETIKLSHLYSFKDNFRNNTARNIFLTGELVRLLTTFSESEVEAVPYKGPALALIAYGHLSLRRFVDLDIMVRKCDVKRAIELLERQGYQTQNELTPAQLTLLLSTQHNLPFMRDQGRLLVELHWEVASRNYADKLQAEILWMHLQTMKMNGVEVLTLSPEDLLLSLCVHGTKHLWERLAWICDAAELINASPGLDWELVFDKATESGYAPMLLLMLHLTSVLLDAKLPCNVRDRAFADQNMAKVAGRVTRRLFDQDGYKPIGFVENMKFNFGVRNNWRNRIRYLKYIMTPTDGDLSVVAFPPSLSFLYYLLRPFRLILKGSTPH